MNRRDRVSFGTMPNPNNNVKQDLPSSTAEYVLSSHRYSVRLYMDSYSANIGNINKSEYGP